jgi:hypothetical protein
VRLEVKIARLGDAKVPVADVPTQMDESRAEVNISVENLATQEEEISKREI